MLTVRRWADVATVTLLVGEAKTAFQVHEADLFEASTFFKAAFTSDFRESGERTMTLPEDDEATFDLFVEWLYHQRDHLPQPPKANVKGKDRYMQPFQLYVLADKYDIRSLKSLIVSQVFTAFKQDSYFLNCAAMVYAYEHTSPNSTIRKLIADRFACIVKRGWVQLESKQKWLRDHADITTDALISLTKQVRTQSCPFDGEMPEDYKEKEPESGNGK